MRELAYGVAFACLLGPAIAQTFAPLVRPWHVGRPSAFDTARRRLVMIGDDGAAVLEPLSSNGLVLTQGVRLTLGD